MILTGLRVYEVRQDFEDGLVRAMVLGADLVDAVQHLNTEIPEIAEMACNIQEIWNRPQYIIIPDKNDKEAVPIPEDIPTLTDGNSADFSSSETINLEISVTDLQYLCELAQALGQFRDGKPSHHVYEYIGQIAQELHKARKCIVEHMALVMDKSDERLEKIKEINYA